jgi:sulfur-carrier protein adenylyltransferase/sulfurtransferase
MRLRQLFTPVKSMTIDEMKTYAQKQTDGSYTLLDVRQPKEYDQVHIPGAVLMPLPELDVSADKLAPEKPIIVYCAVGGRSRVAAQLLSGKGFSTVYNLKGGIKAWQGATATGPREFNLDLISGEETAAEMIALAYEMEGGLARFYESAREKATDPDVEDLLTTLIKFESTHQRALAELYKTIAPEEDNLAVTAQRSMIEGGFPLPGFLKENEPYLQAVTDILQLAMMVEAQALDLYLRFAEKTETDDAKQSLFVIAGEERKHLAALARLYERKI